MRLLSPNRPLSARKIITGFELTRPKARASGVGAALAGILLFLAGCGPRAAEGCTRTFVRYEPSAWESEWAEGEISGKRREKECDILATPAEVARTTLLIRSIQDATLHNKPIPQEAMPLFSRMVYSVRCGGKTRESVELIEPLIGILRDPLTICPRAPGVPDDLYKSFPPGDSAIQSKRHLLPLAATGLGGHGFFESKQSILIDMGASKYDSWRNDPASIGAKWFVDRFGHNGWSFDWIISYEADKYSPDDIYRSVPPEIIPHYIYYNQPVDKDPAGKWNPWRILKGMRVSPDDYVLVKLDIDAPAIENALMDQLMEDRALLGLIDEMFYEHHVNTRPMWGFWQTQTEKATLADSYRNFKRLRSAGVRMHSWP